MLLKLLKLIKKVEKHTYKLKKELTGFDKCQEKLKIFK